MNEKEAIARAQQFWDAGSRAAALELLKERVRRRPIERDARLALAERYRLLNAPDQAGRWGIATPGWTTAVERDRLARMLAASGVRSSDVHRILELPRDDLPTEVQQVLVDAERYRVRYQAEYRERNEPVPEGPWETLATVLWVLVFVVVVLGIVATWVGALLGASMTVFARWVSFSVLVAIALACLTVGGSRTRERRLVAAAGWLAAAVLLLLGSARLVALAIAHGGAIVFSWEG